jgi:hypothetical protein
MNTRLVIDEQSFRQTERQLGRLPGQLRNKVLPPALRSAALPAAAKMRQLAPDSKKTGSRNRWSKKTRLARVTTKQHRKTIGVSTVRKYSRIVAIYAGPIHPAGNLINVIGHPHKQMLWGKYGGRTIPANDYVIRAGKLTERQQAAVFEARVKQGVIREALKR